MTSALRSAEDALMMHAPVGRGHDPRALHQQARDARRAAPARGLRAVLARIAEAVRRRHAIAELRSLSDRELADIGLQRSEIPYVLDRAADAEAPRSPARAMRAANDVVPAVRAAA